MAARRGDQPGQDQHPGVRGGLAHGQPGVRGHPQPLRPDPQRGRQQRRRRRGAGRADDLPGRRQRPGRLAAQPGQLLQRRRPPAVAGPGAAWPFAEVADVLGVEGPMGRTVADVALLLAVSPGRTRGVPLALDAPPPATDRAGRGGRAAGRGTSGGCGWPGAPTSGCPSSADVLAALAPARAGARRPGLRGRRRRARTWPAPTRRSGPGGPSGFLDQVRAAAARPPRSARART